MTIQELNNELGNLDIYLLDQILKGRYLNSKKILDAGCGEGRNLIWFLKNNYDVFGVDYNPAAIRMLQFVARSINPSVPKENFVVGTVENLPFPDSNFDGIICSAVLHFAADEDHLNKMFGELIRVLRKEGTLFIRMASNIGAESNIPAKSDGKTAIPDGSMRFLLTRKHIESWITQYSLKPAEPVKTVNVEDKRFMTNLVLVKS